MARRGRQSRGGNSLYRSYKSGNKRRLANLNRALHGGSGGSYLGGGGSNAANREMAQAQKAALGVPANLQRQYESNPYLQQLRQGISQWASNPGLDTATIGRLQGAARARSAADLVAGQRNLAAGAAARGISGARLASLQNANRMRASVGSNQVLNQIATNAATNRIQDRGNALGALGNLVNQQTNFQTRLGSMLMNQYNQWQPQSANLSPYKQQLARARSFNKNAPPPLQNNFPINTTQSPQQSTLPLYNKPAPTRHIRQPINHFGASSFFPTAPTPTPTPYFQPSDNANTMFNLGGNFNKKNNISSSAFHTVYGF